MTLSKIIHTLRDTRHNLTTEQARTVFLMWVLGLPSPLAARHEAQEYFSRVNSDAPRSDAADQFTALLKDAAEGPVISHSERRRRRLN